MKKFFALILTAILLVSLLASCAPAAPVAAAPVASGGSDTAAAPAAEPAKDAITLKFTHALSTTSQYQAGAEEFKRLVEERTGGAIVVEIYPSAQLGGERDTFEGLQVGTVDVALGTASVLGQTFTLDTGVFSLPFLFSNSDQLYKTLDSDLAKEIFSGTAAYGAEVLTCYDSGFRQLSNSVRPVNILADCAGLKIRIPESSMYVDTMEALGISPSALAWNELFSALQTGVVDGQETPIAVFASNGLGEVQKYFAFTNYMDDPIAMVVSSLFMDKLTVEQQEIVRQAAYESAVFEREWLADYEAGCVDSLKAEFGVEFTYPDTAEFKAAALPVYATYSNQDQLKKVQEFIAGLN